jgi:hypothetical protein
MNCFVCGRAWHKGGVCVLGLVHHQCFYRHGWCGCVTCGEIFPSLFQCCLHKRYANCNADALALEEKKLTQRIAVLQRISALRHEQAEELKSLDTEQKGPVVEFEVFASN